MQAFEQPENSLMIRSRYSDPIVRHRKNPFLIIGLGVNPDTGRRSIFSILESIAKKILKNLRHRALIHVHNWQRAVFDYGATLLNSTLEVFDGPPHHNVTWNGGRCTMF